MDRDAQRKALRDEACKAQPIPFEEKPLPVRPVVRCDPPAAPAAPPVFIPPSGEPDDADYFNPNPAPLTIYNDAITRSCSFYSFYGPVGDDYTVPFGTFLSVIAFEDVPDISDAQLTFIQFSSDSLLSVLSVLTPEQISAALKLTIAQAVWLKDAIVEAQAVVAQSAESEAEQSIDCAWTNVEQTSSCPVDSLAPPSPEGYEVINPSTTLAGVILSKHSQRDADLLALEQALSTRRCLWGNDEVTVTCADLGYSEAVPVEETSLSDRPARNGSVTIPANTFFSYTSKQDANDIAYEQALSGLVCYYVNNEADYTCSYLGKEGVWDEGAADFANSVPGSSIHVPAGAVVSSVSTVDADYNAQITALSLLICQWRNVEVTVVCENQIAFEGSEGEVEIPPSESSPSLEATIPAGTVISDISQEDANTSATEIAEQQLDCVYCNAEIPPLCVLSSLVPPIPVPIPKVWITAEWSVDATMGVAAGTFCSDDAEASQQLAETIGALPAALATDEGDGCYYENSEQRAECPSDVSAQSSPPPGEFVYMAAGVIRIRDTEVPAEFLPAETLSVRAKMYADYLAYSQAQAMTDCFWDNALKLISCPYVQPSGHKGTVGGLHQITVPVGMFRSYTSQVEADAFASVYGESLLNCVYFGTADAICGYAPVNDPAPNTPHDTPGALYSTHAEAYSTESPAAADAVAALIAEGQLQCIYGNLPVTADDCPQSITHPENTIVNIGIEELPANYFISEISPANAQAVAQDLVNSLRVCVAEEIADGGGGGGEDGAAGADGLPGNDGAQTGCDGQCFGVYS